MTRQALKKLEKDVVRAAMRWAKWSKKRPPDLWHMLDANERLDHACARLAQRKPSGK